MKKNCKFCRSEIDEECSVCPVCKQNLNPFKLSPKNPNFYSFILIGLGIVLMFAIPAYIKAKTKNDFKIKSFTDAKTHNLKILWSKEMGKGSKRYIVGEIKNDGVDTFSSVLIENEFLDKENKLIKMSDAYIPGTFKPGDKRPFQIAHDCLRDDDFIYDYYKLEIVDGSLR